MAKTIWKFDLASKDDHEFEAPEGAKPVFVAVQNGRLCVWVEVNDAYPKAPLLFSVYGTGHAQNEAQERYVGSALMMGGSLVWHVYQR